MANASHRKGHRTRRRKSNGAGRELLAAVRELHQAVMSGDYSKLTVRDVEVPGPGKALRAATVHKSG